MEEACHTPCGRYHWLMLKEDVPGVEKAGTDIISCSDPCCMRMMCWLS